MEQDPYNSTDGIHLTQEDLGELQKHPAYKDLALSSLALVQLAQDWNEGGGGGAGEEN